MSLDWMAWTLPTALFFLIILLMICGMLVWELVSPTVERKGFWAFRPPAARAFSSDCLAQATSTWPGLG